MCVLRQCLAELRVFNGEWSRADAANLQLPPKAVACSAFLERRVTAQHSSWPGQGRRPKQCEQQRHSAQAIGAHS